MRGISVLLCLMVLLLSGCVAGRTPVDMQQDNAAAPEGEPPPVMQPSWEPGPEDMMPLLTTNWEDYTEDFEYHVYGEFEVYRLSKFRYTELHAFRGGRYIDSFFTTETGPPRFEEWEDAVWMILNVHTGWGTGFGAWEEQWILLTVPDAPKSLITSTRYYFYFPGSADTGWHNSEYKEWVVQTGEEPSETKAGNEFVVHTEYELEVSWRDPLLDEDVPLFTRQGENVYRYSQGNHYFSPGLPPYEESWRDQAQFMHDNLDQLLAIARDGNDSQKRWLRLFLAHRVEDWDKLQELMDQMQTQ